VVRAADEADVAKRIASRRFRTVRDGQGRIIELDMFGASDEDLAGLGCLKSLQRLFLANSKVTDAGLRSLQLINVRGTRVTAEGSEDLKKLLPTLKDVLK
jgi:hypothetical protein